MTNVASVCCCFLLCSTIALFSCTKNSDLTNSITQNGINHRLLSNGDALGTETFVPGDSLVVQGDTSNGDETVLLQTYAPDTNRINFVSFNALNPSFSGNGGINRSIIKFKLRHISDSVRNNPPHVQKAILYLYQYHRPADMNPYTSFQNANSVELHRIAGRWQSGTVTWNNQPALAKGSANPLEDVVIIPPVATPLHDTHDDLEVDITDMINKVISSHNYNGFLLKLPKDEESFLVSCGRSYGSFACPYPQRRPKLVLYF